MEYPNIIAAVPQDEHFDASAVNEGVWMSEAHLGSIETTLAANTEAIASIKSQFDSEALARQQAETALAAANDSNAEKDNTIAAQAAEIAALKEGPAATITTTTKEKDDLGDGKVVQESETTKEARRLRAMRDGK